MQTEWFKGLDAEETDNLKKSLLHHKIMLDKLVDLCYNRCTELNKVKISDFDNPNWALRRAYEDGRQAELQSLIKLLTVTDGNPKN